MRNRPLPFPIARLQPGDVLLSAGRGTLSRLMTWNAECPYSHAALIVAPGLVLDPLPPTVRLRTTTSVLAEQPRRLDVYRPFDRLDRPLSPRDRHLLRIASAPWVGQPYPLGRLPMLALDTLLRHKLGLERSLPRRITGEAALTCGELVFNLLATVLPLELTRRQRLPCPFPFDCWTGLLYDLRCRLRISTKRRTRRSAIPLRCPQVDGNALGVITTDLWSMPALRCVGTLLPATSQTGSGASAPTFTSAGTDRANPGYRG